MRNNTVEKAVFLSVRDEKTYKKPATFVNVFGCFVTGIEFCADSRVGWLFLCR